MKFHLEQLKVKILSLQLILISSLLINNLIIGMFSFSTAICNAALWKDFVLKLNSIISFEILFEYFNQLKLHLKKNQLKFYLIYSWKLY